MQPQLPTQAPAIIDSFRGEFGFLSNFYEASIWFDGEKWPTVEHAYQAMKSDDPSVRKLIRTSKSPYVAKRLGRALQLPSDWEARKLEVMLQLVRLKFRNPLLRSLLLATEDATLVEGNTWNDYVWGVCRGKGRNELGKILMQVREEIKREEAAEGLR